LCERPEGMVDLVDVYWLEQTEADVPVQNDWLSARETLRLSGLRFAKRHNDWRLGRWTAKRALAVRLGVPAHPGVLAKIEVLASPSGAPEVFVANKLADLTLSLSHRSGRAVCVVARSGVELGCDLEMVEPRSDSFIGDYFTHEEQELVARACVADRSRLLALLWSAKESTLKALHEGFRLDTRCVIVKPEERFDLNGWSPLQVRYTKGHIFRGWWQCEGGAPRTMVADPAPDAPIRLEIPSYSPDCPSRCA
jgi:4'-phosphopantetheinyl transferase